MEFNHFPLDIQVLILSDNPAFRRINKTLANYGDYMFQEKYALLGVSKHEIGEYMKTKQKFVIYAKNNDNSCTVYEFNYDYICYRVTSYLLHENSDECTRIIYHYFCTLNYLINYIDFIYKNYESIYCDVNTVLKIMKLRCCNKKYTIDYFNNLLTTISYKPSINNLLNIALLSIYFSLNHLCYESMMIQRIQFNQNIPIDIVLYNKIVKNRINYIYNRYDTIINNL